MSNGFINVDSQLKLLKDLKILKEENEILRQQNEELRRKNLALIGDRDTYKNELEKLKNDNNEVQKSLVL